MWGALTTESATPTIELDFLGADATDALLSAASGGAGGTPRVPGAAGGAGKKLDGAAAKAVADARLAQVRVLRGSWVADVGWRGLHVRGWAGGGWGWVGSFAQPSCRDELAPSVTRPPPPAGGAAGGLPAAPDGPLLGGWLRRGPAAQCICHCPAAASGQLPDSCR
jgi:hypothetical protein